jgi:hypothetical protein
VVAIALKTIGEATRFFLARHWVRTRIGPYVVTTTEVRPSAFETSVCWGEDGPEVDYFGSGLAFELDDATANHEAICNGVEAGVGLVRVPATPPPAA